MDDERHIDLIVDTGGAIRMAMLMAHYRTPTEMGEKKISDARKILRRFALACQPNLDGPPVEIIEAVSDDLNTPKAIAIMHRYRKEKKGRELFAALRFLGFFGSQTVIDELKTYPDGSVFADGQYMGPVAVSDAIN